MVALPGGAFRMGSDRHYPEEAPSRLVTVAPFAIDATPVTNAAFAAYVHATGYRTLAERDPVPDRYPRADPALLVAGSIVFDPVRAGPGEWWRYVPGACWRAPLGPGSAADPDHPAVHIAHEDAAAFAAWAGKRLPTEAEWEFAARGGLEGAEFAWGAELAPGGVHRANTWQGRFPHENTEEDGFTRTSPVRHYPSNPFGLWDMIGNVWEWTAEKWARTDSQRPCCAPAGGNAAEHYVIKGGSHLCAPSYCRRYRPAARQPQAPDSGTSHLGFRCVIR